MTTSVDTFRAESLSYLWTAGYDPSDEYEWNPDWALRTKTEKWPDNDSPFDGVVLKISDIENEDEWMQSSEFYSLSEAR